VRWRAIDYNKGRQDAELVQRMRRRTSNLTELDTRVNEDAFDRYATACSNADDGEYGSVDILTVRGVLSSQETVLFLSGYPSIT